MYRSFKKVFVFTLKYGTIALMENCEYNNSSFRIANFVAVTAYINV